MSTRTRTIIALSLVLGLAAVLRWPGLRWGFDIPATQTRFAAFHPDEPRFVEIARGLHGQGAFRQSYVLGFGNLLRLYLAAAESAGRRPDDAELTLAARGLSLVAGVAMVAVAFLFARRMSGSAETGLIAAALVAGNTWCITQSHYGTADMTYTFLLYLFAWLAWIGVERSSLAAGVGAAGIAGLAMAMKFGLVLIPSVLLLAFLFRPRRPLAAILFLGVAVLAFLAAQGFRFGLDGVGMIWKSFTQENVAGGGGPSFWNPLVYAAELVRILGLPVVLLLFLCGRGVRRLPAPAVAAFLPIALHAVSIQFLGLPFPRHLLPVVPLLLVAVAVIANGLPRFRVPAIVIALIWTGILGISDQVAFHQDPRVSAVNWLARTAPQDRTLWADPYFKIRVEDFYPPGSPTQADYLVRHEGWWYRFGRSELNPAGLPAGGPLYHARPVDREIFLQQESDVASGKRRVVFRKGPPLILPEQWLYHRLWGSLEKFAGTCDVLALTDQ